MNHPHRIQSPKNIDNPIVVSAYKFKEENLDRSAIKSTNSEAHVRSNQYRTHQLHKFSNQNRQYTETRNRDQSRDYLQGNISDARSKRLSQPKPLKKIND